MPSLSLLIAVLAVKDTLSRYLLIDIGDKVRESHEYREARKEPFKPGKYMYLSIYSNTSPIIIRSFIYKYENSVCTGKCSGYECLKQYVEKPDSNYAWNDTGIRINGFDQWHLKTWTGYVLNFTSQQWLLKIHRDRFGGTPWLS